MSLETRQISNQLDTIFFESITSNTTKVGLSLSNDELSHKLIDRLIINLHLFPKSIKFVPMNEYTRQLIYTHSLPLDHDLFSSLDLILYELPSGGLYEFELSPRYTFDSVDFLNKKIAFDSCQEVVTISQDKADRNILDDQFKEWERQLQFDDEISLVSIEVIPQVYKRLQSQLWNNHGIDSRLRLFNSNPIRTMNKNYILDLECDLSRISLKELNRKLVNMIGVVETSLFVDLIDRSYLLTDTYLFKTFAKRPMSKI